MDRHGEQRSVSAIVATVDRTTPLRRLLESLAAQTSPLAEVIVVDQNDAPLPDAILRERAWPFLLHHVHCPRHRGVSRARNLGWRQAAGQWLLFPDDDCWYPPDYVERALALASEHSADIMAGRPTDPTGRTINGRFENTAGPITRSTAFTSEIEWNTLIRHDAMKQLGGYDEALSLGGDTPWQGSEGLDLVLRAILLDLDCRYDPDLVAHHAELPVDRPDRPMVRKGRDYGRSLGRVLALHGFGFWGVAYWMARSAGNLAASLAKGRFDRAWYYLNQMVGRFEGGIGRTLPFPPYPGPAQHRASPVAAAAPVPTATDRPVQQARTRPLAPGDCGAGVENRPGFPGDQLPQRSARTR